MSTEKEKINFFKKEFIDKKIGKLKSQKALIIKLLFETGIKPCEIRRIVGITNETLTVFEDTGKLREVFHNINTTSQIKDFSIEESLVTKWIEDVLGQEYNSDSIRISHGRRLVLNGANPRMVQIQMGFENAKEMFEFLQISKNERKGK